MVCASLTADGSWLSLGATHPEHGFVELSALPLFDEAHRGDPARTRDYRQLMIDPRFAFLTFEGLPGGASPVSVSCRASIGTLRHRRDSVGWSMTVLTRAERGAPAIRQDLVLRRDTTSSRPDGLHIRFAGRLDRPALAEITEVDPPRPTGAVTALATDGPVLRVGAARLPAEAEVRLVSAGEAAWRLHPTTAEIEISWPAGAAELRLAVEVSLTVAGRDGERSTRSRRRRRGTAAGRRSTPFLPVPQELRGDIARLRRRALEYIVGCTCLRVAPDRSTLLTDHRILPLSWTRDGYYQALLLLRQAEVAGREDLAALVDEHLRWLWLDCERPDATWARSHHANGSRKDEVFQADQQLYPLLELHDFWRTTGRLPALPDAGPGAGGWPTLVGQVLDRVVGALAGDGLLATDENAADDRAGGAYVLANQILAWHVLHSLGSMVDVLNLAVRPAEVADRIRRTVEEKFVADGPDGQLWAYAVSAAGEQVLYHDANDIPTALAPLWGFCAADDPRWLGTLRHAFGPLNEGYATGRFGGLGSHHTPGTWSLGLIQEWAAWTLAGEPDRAREALAALTRLALVDGSLPEASHPETGRALARHWFAWPGALLGALAE